MNKARKATINVTQETYGNLERCAQRIGLSTHRPGWPAETVSRLFADVIAGGYSCAREMFRIARPEVGR